MEKREFLKNSLFLGIAAACVPLLEACKTTGKTAAALPPPARRHSGDFTLPALQYEPGALEPHIDKMTMEIHHGKHHQGSVNNLNAAIKGTVYADYELEDILARVTTADADKAIRNNAGGHWNHAMFWQIMSADGGGAPTGALANAIQTSFGGFDKFQEQFSNAAKGVFGSGWAWLSVAQDKKLFISATPNQDNPLMTRITGQTGTPILGIDVWEHAYYLKNQNRRADYINAFYKVVNWKAVSLRYEAAMAK